MIDRVIHRRKALACFLGGSITTLLAVLPWMSSSESPVATPEVPKIQSGEWTPPTHWDLEPPESKDRFLAIDHWVFDEQRANGTPSPNVAFVVNFVMGLNGANDAKAIVVRYLGDTQNPHYLINVANGLEPARTDALTRVGILTTIRAVWNVAGRSLPSGPLLALLQNYKLSENETSGRALAVLARLISDIENN